MKKCLTLIFMIAMIAPQMLCAQAPQFVSEYTSLTDCVKVAPSKSDKSMPRDFLQMKCPGRDGYTVYNEAGDIYGWLRLVKGDLEIRTNGGLEKLIGPFVSGKKLEWRYMVEGGKRQLVAVIYRVKGNDRTAYNAGNTEKYAEYLNVVRISDNVFCEIGLVSTNEAARKLADSQKACALD